MQQRWDRCKAHSFGPGGGNVIVSQDEGLFLQRAAVGKYPTVTVVNDWCNKTEQREGKKYNHSYYWSFRFRFNLSHDMIILLKTIIRLLEVALFLCKGGVK